MWLFSPRSLLEAAYQTLADLETEVGGGVQILKLWTASGAATSGEERERGCSPLAGGRSGGLPQEI